MKPINKTLSPLGRAFSIALDYLLRDEFTTTASAPLTSPRTCEPGPGTLVFSGTPTNESITGDALVWSELDPLYLASSIAFERSAGLSLFSKISANAGKTHNLVVGLSAAQHNASYTTGNAMFASNGLIIVYPGPVLLDSVGNVIIYFMIVLRSIGAFYLFSTDNTTWKVAFVDNSATTANMYSMMRNSATAGRASSVDKYRVQRIASPLNTDYGIATNRTASPTAGATTTSEANALVEMTWQASTGATWEVMVRRTDDNNCWIVRGSQAGSTIKLIEKNAGVETERSSAAQTWTNGTSYRLVVIMDGNTIKTFVANTAKNSYASASFNNTATGVKTSHAGTDLVAWPRTLSGAALAELERWTA